MEAFLGQGDGGVQASVEEIRARVGVQASVEEIRARV
jgi:hypothetical protein